MLHAVTLAAYALHIGGGLVGLVSGMLALFVRKAGRLHRNAGNVFFVSMSVMATFAIYLGLTLPDPVNVFIGAFSLYLVATAWMAARHKGGAVGPAEKLALLVAVILLAPFALLSFQLAAGMDPTFKSSVPFKGPVLVAIYCFTCVLALAAIGDAHLVLAGRISGASRIARHLWRMCLALTLATGSAFTNGLPRLLPASYHFSPIFFLPQLVPLAMLVFWMIRVRLTGWYRARQRMENGPSRLYY